MVDKRLRLGVVLGHIEGRHQRLFDQLQVRLRLKRSIERNHGSGALQTVTGHLQLIGRVDVLHAELDAGPSRRPSHPDIQVSFLPGLEEQKVQATVHVA